MPAIFQVYKLKGRLAARLGAAEAEALIPEHQVEGRGLSPEERAERMNGILRTLEGSLEAPLLSEVRRESSCNLTERQRDVLLHAKDEHDERADQLGAINEGLRPSRIEARGAGYSFVFGYGRCVCGMFRRLEHASSSASFCECCAGNVEKIFAFWLDAPVRADMVSSCLVGGSDCQFTIRLDKASQT